MYAFNTTVNILYMILCFFGPFHIGIYAWLVKDYVSSARCLTSDLSSLSYWLSSEAGRRTALPCAPTTAVSFSPITVWTNTVPVESPSILQGQGKEVRRNKERERRYDGECIISIISQGYNIP